MSSTRFRAPWERTLLIVTALAAPLLALIAPLAAYSGVAALMQTSPAARIFGLLLIAVGPLTTLLAFAWAPRHYQVTDDAFVIERWLGRIVVPARSIRRVRRFDRAELRGTLRTAGSGGLFGYYGRFWNRQLGHFRMYATRSKDFVLVEAERPYLVTPERIEDFLEALARAGASGVERSAGTAG